MFKLGIRLFFAAIMSETGKSEAEVETCVNISEGGEDEDAEEDQEEDVEEDEEADEEESEEGVGMGEEKGPSFDYEDDRIIIGTNVKSRSDEEGNYDEEYFKFWSDERQNEDNFVMKICNHFQENERCTEEKEQRRLFFILNGFLLIT